MRLTRYGRQLVADVAERAAWTFLQGFLGVFTLTDTSTARTAAIAGCMAVLSMVKSAAAARVPSTISPASTVRQ
jgi:hypothetical protein